MNYFLIPKNTDRNFFRIFIKKYISNKLPVFFKKFLRKNYNNIKAYNLNTLRIFYRRHISNKLPVFF